MLTENGLSVRQAAAMLAVGGVGQVAGRLFYTRLASVTTSSARTWILLGVVALTTAGLAEIHRPLAVVGVLAFLGGTARGLFTLVQATAISDRWGPHRFGARNGVLSGSTMTASALAPWVGASMAASLDGYTAAFWCLAVAVAAGGALIRPPRAAPG
jgi:predicted MFS family arabinose efflux permease